MELERIFLLKSQGVQSVLDDIAKIDAAFRASALASSNLAGDSSMFDVDQLKVINAQLTKMIGIQKSLLTALKGVGGEFSKTNDNLTNVAQSSTDATGGIEDLSKAAKNLGTNLSGVTPQLLKVQSTLNVGNIEAYEDGIHALTAKYLQLRDVLEILRIEKKALDAENENEAISSYEYDQRLENLNVKYFQTNTSIHEVTRAMELLNVTYNGAVPAEYTLAVQQQNKELILAAKSTQDFIDKQIELGVIQDVIQTKIKAGIYEGTGKQAADENALLEKQILFGEAYVAMLDQENVKLLERQAILRANQEIKGEAIANSIEADQSKASQKAYAAQPQQQAFRKADMQEERTQVELLKNQSIAANEAAGYMQRLSAQINVYRIQLRLMSEEDRMNPLIGGRMATQAKALDDELRGLNKTVGDSTRDIGKYGLALGGVHNIQTMFLRQLIRGVGSIVIFSILFEGVTKLGEAMMEAIPGTDAYIKKQQELEKVLEDTQTQLTALIAKTDEYNKNILNALGSGEMGVQAEIDAIKAKGVVNAQTHQAEVEQLKAAQKLREKQIFDLDGVLNQYKKLNDIFHDIDKGGDYNRVRKQISDLHLGDNDQAKFDEMLRTYEKNKNQYKTDDNGRYVLDKDGAQIPNPNYSPNAKLFENDEIVKARATALAQADKLMQDSDNAKTELASKTNATIYSKNVGLNSQLKQLDEAYRQLKEKEDINSIDKIVADVEAKYQAMNSRIRQEAVQYAKSVSVDVPLIGTADNEDFNAEYYALPQNVRKKYDDILNKNGGNKAQEEKNQKEEFYQSASAIALQHHTKEGQIDADSASKYSGYGKAHYDAMRDALDKETDAKKAAVELEFSTERDAYVKNGDDITNIVKERDAKLELLEKDKYQKGLQLGMEYFKRISENASDASDNVITQIDNIYRDRETSVLGNKKLSDFQKDKRVSRLENKNIIDRANEEIVQGQTSLPEAKQATDKAEADVKAAKNKDELTIATKAYNTALANQLLIEGKISKAQHDKMIAQNALVKDQKDLYKQLIDGALQIAQTLADSYFQLLSKQDAYRHEMAERSLAWNQKIQESEVQSNNEKLAEDKANTIAQHQLDKDKAIQDNKRAEQQIIVNAVIASGKALSQDAPDWPKFAIDEGVILAQTAIQESFLASAPAYASGFNPYKVAWVGDGGESELLHIGNSFSVSPSSPTLIDSTNLKSVTPFSSIANVPGNLGAGLKAPSFTTSSSNSRSGGGSNHTAEFAEIHGILKTVVKGMANINVNYNSTAAQRAGLKASYKTNKI